MLLLANKMADFIKKHPVATVHIIINIIVVGSLLYYVLYLKRALSQKITAVERRVHTLEKPPIKAHYQHTIPQQPRRASPKQPPARKQQVCVLGKCTLSPPPAPSPPPPVMIVEEEEEEELDGVEERDVIDQEIDEELGKLIDFASSSLPQE